MKQTPEQIKNQLLQMKTLDQKLRNQNPTDWDKLSKIDQRHTNILKETVKEYGLIDTQRFGEDGATAACIIVQHAPKTEIAFMEQYLQLMKNTRDKVNPKHIAYLEDRINMYKEHPQTYGTQLVSDQTGKMVFYKISDIGTVDENRARANMGTIEEYASKFDPTVELPRGYIANN